MLKKEGLVLRLWVALSLLWTLIFGYHAFDAWQAWEGARQGYEEARAIAVAEAMLESEGIESFEGSTMIAEAQRDRFKERREETENKLFLAFVLLVAGPVGIGATIGVVRWVIAGTEAAA